MLRRLGLSVALGPLPALLASIEAFPSDQVLGIRRLE